MRCILWVFVGVMLLMACNSGSHFIANESYRRDVERDFKAKRELLPDSLFAFYGDDGLSLKEREAMMFLYAYMPIGDIVDYESDFYLDNVRAAFLAKEEMEWGSSVPDVEFRHFVLPVRVNNENMDSSRMVFYRELRERVKGMSMYEAALEVNHWCHEKVVYMPSDGRTSSPLASVRTAYGRCGEESTFAVAALRSVGIPARQVYTPRWAHCDDNHAWVEVWADGKWYYMGACEPEPQLNMGWFAAPSQRAMLVHTKVFGSYDGSEDVINRTPCFTEINVIKNYAPTKLVQLRAVDSTGRALVGAKMSLGLYNYAEYYPLIVKRTDGDGLVKLTTGRGDLMISVYDSVSGMYGYDVYPGDMTDIMDIVVDRVAGKVYSEAFDLVPPVEHQVDNAASAEMKKANEKRLQLEDDIRNEYVATFIDKSAAFDFAREMSLDTTTVWNYLQGSRGNYAVIQSFIRNVPEAKRGLAMELLGAVSAKDLRDCEEVVLMDNVLNTQCVDSLERDVFVNYLLNPRVETEMLTPYKGKLKDRFKGETAMDVSDYVRSLKTFDDKYTQRYAMSPDGVMRVGGGDRRSKNILFVAICRSIGIPARVEEVTGKVEYFDEGMWRQVNFNGDAMAKSGGNGSGWLKLTCEDSGANPKYYINFALAKYVDGAFLTLSFPDDATFKDLFSSPVQLDEGYYRLITGNRMISGSVLVNETYFNVERGKTTDVVLSTRKSLVGGEVFATISLDVNVLVDGKELNIGKELSRGNFVMAIIDPNKEPTNHLLTEMYQKRAEFEQWNRPIYLFFTSEVNRQLFLKGKHFDLPKNVILGVDNQSEVMAQLMNRVGIKNVNELPILIFVNHSGEVSYCTQGYKIGVGEQLIKIIKGE